MINNQKFSLILSIIALSLSLMTILNVHFQKPVFATVDMAQLINLQASHLGQRYPEGNVPAAVMQQVIAEIKEQIKKLTQNTNVILLAKGAVLNNTLPDYTDLLKESLEEQETQDEERQVKEEQ